MAERQGFEPWEGINPQRFSRPPLSATQPPLLKRRYNTQFLDRLKAFYLKKKIIDINQSFNF